jgi:hypothetical protein
LINNSGQPEDLIILGTPQFNGEFSLRNNIDIKAAIYTPSAIFSIRNNIDFYGALNCDQIGLYPEVTRNINFHYDESLADLNYIVGGIKYWRLTTWHEPLGN